MIAEMRSGFRTIATRLDTQDATLDAVVREGQRANSRLTRIEERVDDFEGRIGRNSQRARQDSEMDLSRDAKLAEVIVWRNSVDERLAATATKTDLETATDAQTTAIVGAIGKAASSPLLKMIGTAILGILTGYAASRGWVSK